MTLIFNDSAVRIVLSNPQRALDKRDSIWNAHEGYRQMLAWHKRQSVPENYEFYDFALNDMISDNPRFTKDKDYLGIVNKIQDTYIKYSSAINQHLSSYLPGDKKFISYAYFVLFTHSYAFSLENKLIIDIGSPRWNNDPGFIINNVIHETYHIGYELYTPDTWGFKPKSKEEFLQKTYAIIQNEGMAVYVAYRALDFIPSDYIDPDYKLLKNPEKVDIAFKQTNLLIKEADTANIDSLNNKAWIIGTDRDRAFYVVGSYIAQTLEKEKGKKFLVELIKKDSKVFIKEYNKIAEDKRKIIL